MTKTKPWDRRVKTLVEKKGGLEALAAELGMSYFTVLRWTKGTNKPSSLAQKELERIEKGEK